MSLFPRPFGLSGPLRPFLCPFGPFQSEPIRYVLPFLERTKRTRDVKDQRDQKDLG